MPWMIIAVAGPATAGLLLLGGLAVRVYREVLLLSGELDAGARRISGAARSLESAAEPVARRAGGAARKDPPPFLRTDSESA